VIPLVDGLKVVIVLTGSLIGAFLIYPLLLLFLVGAGGIFSAITTPSFVASLGITLTMSTAAAAVSVVLGTPMGYFLARYNFRFKEFVEAIVDIPIVIPHVIVGLMILIAFASDFGLGPYLQRVGLNVVNSWYGAIMAVLYLSSTYTIRVVDSAVRLVSPDLELTARTLGANPAFAFRHVVLPKIWRSIANGALLTWARATSETGALLIVSYYVPFFGSLAYPAPIYIYQGYIGAGLIDAVKFSAALVVVVIAIFVSYRLLVVRAPLPGN